MPERSNNQIYLSLIDELELQQINEPVPVSPMTPEEAIDYAESLMHRSIELVDAANAASHPNNRGSQLEYYKAYKVAGCLSKLRDEILDEVPHEHIAYLAANPQTKQ